MNKENIILTKSFSFAIEVVRFYQYLSREKKEFVLSKQLLRSGTSIGANIHEAQGAHSKKDFLSAMTIAYKEAKELFYWILLIESTIIKSEETQILKERCEELLKILSKIKQTIKIAI